MKVAVILAVINALLLAVQGQGSTEPDYEYTSSYDPMENVIVVEHLTNATGSITLEEEVVEGIHMLWVLEGVAVDGVLSTTTTINVTRLHLPYISHTHGTSNDSSYGHFLLIGAGRSVLSNSKEVMFYGVRSKVGKVKVVGTAAHVYLRLFPPSPFLPPHNVSLTIDYRRTEQFPTEPPVTTTPAPSYQGFNNSAWADLNGIPLKKGVDREYLDGVKKAVSTILRQHFSEQNSSVNVTEEDVLILEARQCPRGCSEECVAYNVTCAVWGQDEKDEPAWVSDRHLLQALFNNESFSHQWTHNIPGGPVWVCQVGGSVLGVGTWLLLAGLAVVVVSLNLIVMKLQKKSSIEDMRVKFIKVEEEREEDRKRRRSEATSIFGLYGSVASRASERSHIPFQKKDGRDDSDSDGDVKEPGDPSKDYTRGIPLPQMSNIKVPAAMEPHYFDNTAFVDDENLFGHSSEPQTSTWLAFDDDDSDDSSTVHFNEMSP